MFAVAVGVVGYKCVAAVSAATGAAIAAFVTKQAIDGKVAKAKKEAKIEAMDELHEVTNKIEAKVEASKHCVLCDNERSVVLRPCGHIPFCQECYYNTKEGIIMCPICATPIEDTCAAKMTLSILE